MNRLDRNVDAARKFGVYLHVPFCSTICDFCGFYQATATRDGIERYLDGVDKELALIDCERQANTIFWGGGTPGLLPARDLERLCAALANRFGAPLDEWTVEMAPSSVKPDKLQVLKDCGVTRISMGIQSLDDALLDKLGRQHSRKQALQAYELVRSHGFDSVNIDMMFALPGQTEDGWRSDLAEAAALAPDHLSTYCLTFEEDTALFVKLSEGKLKIDVETERSFYRASWEVMEAHGYGQYEISNYSRPGHRSAHNLNVWRMEEWIGIGPSAASQYGGWRYSNTPDLGKWLEQIDAGEFGTSDRVLLSDALLFEDSLIFGLRMNDGVDLSEVERRFGIEIGRAERIRLDKWRDDGLLEQSGERIRLTGEGRLLADAIGSELIGSMAL